MMAAILDLATNEGCSSQMVIEVAARLWHWTRTCEQDSLGQDCLRGRWHQAMWPGLCRQG